MAEHKCNICFEPLSANVVFTPCIHGFHKDCIQGWIDIKKEILLIPCPVCKYDIAELAGYRDISNMSLYEPASNAGLDWINYTNDAPIQFGENLFISNINEVMLRSVNEMLNRVANYHNDHIEYVEPDDEFSVYREAAALFEEEPDNDQQSNLLLSSEDVADNNPMRFREDLLAFMSNYQVIDISGRYADPVPAEPVPTEPVPTEPVPAEPDVSNEFDDLPDLVSSFDTRFK